MDAGFHGFGDMWKDIQKSMVDDKRGMADLQKQGNEIQKEVLGQVREMNQNLKAADEKKEMMPARFGK